MYIIWKKLARTAKKNWYLFSGLCYRLYNDQEGTDSILFPGFCLDAPDDDILKLSYDTPYLCDPVTVGGSDMGGYSAGDFGIL